MEHNKQGFQAFDPSFNKKLAMKRLKQIRSIQKNFIRAENFIRENFIRAENNMTAREVDRD